MKLDNKNHSHEEIIGVQESNALRISEDSQAMIIDSLINLYSDPVGSVVRELTSNCIDAHRERDLKKSGKLSLSTDDDLSWFDNRLSVSVSLIDSNPLLGLDSNISFNDYGVGLSPQRVKDIYTVLGTSTKRDDNHQIGGFGLGCKSPWAYVDKFYVNTRHNGTEYFYLMHKGETVPSMDLVHTRETTEKNGTSVIVPLTDRTNHSVNKFVKAINSQLPFFENVVYEGFESYGNISKWKVEEETEDYVITPMQSSYEKKMLIGKVVYPLDTDLLGEINFKGRTINLSSDLVLKFPIGVLDLVPSREAVRYTYKTKQAITNHLTKVLTTFEREVQDAINNLDDLYTAYRMYRQLRRNSYAAPRVENTDILVFKSLMIKKEDLDIDLGKWDLNIPGVNMDNIMYALNVYKLQKDYSRSGNAKIRPYNVDVNELFGKGVTVYSVADKFNYRTNQAVYDGSYDARSLYAFKWRTRANSSQTSWRSVGYQFNNEEDEVTEGSIYSPLEEKIMKIQVSLKKHLHIPGLLVYENVDTSDVDDEIAEQEETPEQRRKRLGKVFYREVHLNSFVREEVDAVDIMASGCEKMIFGFQDDVHTLRDIKYIMSAAKSDDRLLPVAISKSAEKHFLRHYYVTDFIQLDERFRPLLYNCLDKLYEYHTTKKYSTNHLVKKLNRDVYIYLENVEYMDNSSHVEGQNMYEYLKNKYMPDFEPSSETKLRIAKMKAWYDKMSILNSRLIGDGYYNIDFIGINFLLKYMDDNDIPTTLKRGKMSILEALANIKDLEGMSFQRLIDYTFNYNISYKLRNECNNATTDDEQWKIIENALVEENLEKVKEQVVDFYLTKNIVIELVEEAVPQLLLEL
jgi:hypothetical protein